MPSECDKKIKELEEQNSTLQKQTAEAQRSSAKSNRPGVPNWLSTLLSQMQTFLSVIVEKQICDAECQRTKKLSELEKEMRYAEKNENEERINLAQNAYHTLRDGQVQNINRFNKKYIEIGNNEQERYVDIKDLLNKNIGNSKNNLLSFFISIDNISNVITFTENENKNLKKKINEIKSNINVNDRKYFYRQQYLKFKSYIKYFLTAIFIICCLLHLYLSDIKNNFMPHKMYYIGIISLMISYLFIVNNLFYYILK